MTTSTHPWRFGTKSHPYALLETSVSEEWATPAGKAWNGYRELATRPESPADKKAWRRDGSPTQWGKTIDGKIVKLSGKHSKGHVGLLLPDRGQFLGRGAVADVRGGPAPARRPGTVGGLAHEGGPRRRAH
ncbi:hypothetical protein ACFSTC_62830 [Nonomuraea ferruginea]